MISFYGGNSENSLYKFEIEYIQIDNEGHFTNALNITDKQVETAEKYTFSPFVENVSLSSLFAVEDYLLFSLNRDIMRLDLNDFSLSTVCMDTGMEKVLFGKMFDFGDEDVRFHSDGAFADGNTVYVYDKINGVAKLGLYGKPKLLFTDDTSFGPEYNGSAFYYISQDEKLHKFDLSSGKSIVFFECATDRFTLDGDAEFLYFQSYVKDVKLNKSMEVGSRKTEQRGGKITLLTLLYSKASSHISFGKAYSFHSFWIYQRLNTHMHWQRHKVDINLCHGNIANVSRCSYKAAAFSALCESRTRQSAYFPSFQHSSLSVKDLSCFLGSERLCQLKKPRCFLNRQMR